MCESARVFFPGDLVFKSEPLFAVLDKKWREERCDLCFSTFVEGHTCPGCQQVQFCGQACLVRSLEGTHGQECKYMKKKPLLSDNTRLVLQALLEIRDLNNNNDLSEEVPDLGLSRSWSGLESHEDRLAASPARSAAASAVAREVADLDPALIAKGGEGDREIREIVGKLVINSFSRGDSHNQRLGASLHLSASALDHSCEPNACFTFDADGYVAIRALQKISLDKGDRVQDKVFISYLDLMDSTRGRRRQLESRYHFRCTCARCCRDDETGGEGDPLYSLRCQNREAGCSGRPVAVGADPEADPTRPTGVCPECGKAPTREILEKYVNLCRSASPEEVLASGLLHPRHHLYARCARRQFDAKAASAQSDRDSAQSARELGVLCLATYSTLRPHVLPSLGQLLLKLARLELTHFSHSEEIREDGIEHAEDALGAISTTHGEDHELFSEAAQLLASHQRE